MAQLEDKPRDRRCEASLVIFTLVAQCSLNAETTWDIRVVHELVLFHGEVAIDGQRAVDFVDEGGLSVCNCR